MSKRLLVVGSTNVDFRLETPYIPAPGETLLSAKSYSLTAGGKGANSAMAAVRLSDCPVTFCARVGADNYGTRLKNYFDTNGINTEYIVTDKSEQTGAAFVMVEDDGTNRIVVYTGANKNLNEIDVNTAMRSMPEAILAQYEGCEEALIAASVAASRNGLPFFVDAGAAKASWKLERMPRCEIFSPNETETEALTGIRPSSVENCLKAAIALCSRTKIHYVALKLGGRGCFIYDGKYCDLVSSYDVPEVDTTAAGDAFTAAIATEYMRTGDIIRAAKFANAAGALTVSKAGSMTSIPTESEVRALMATQNI